MTPEYYLKGHAWIIPKYFLGSVFGAFARQNRGRCRFLPRKPVVQVQNRVLLKSGYSYTKWIVSA